MRIAVVSDIHDHIHNLRAVLERLDTAELLLCPGDLCAPFMVDELADGAAFDLVCCGHSHEWEAGREGGTLYVNPGEVMGRLGPVTAALVDTATGEVERVQVDGVPA